MKKYVTEWLLSRGFAIALPTVIGIAIGKNLGEQAYKYFYVRTQGKENEEMRRYYELIYAITYGTIFAGVGFMIVFILEYLEEKDFIR